MAPPAPTITVALDMSKAFDTINIHTLIRKLLQTNIPGSIIKFIANYIKGRKAYTTYRNYTSKQRQFKTGVPHGGVLSPTLFNTYTHPSLLCLLCNIHTHDIHHLFNCTHIRTTLLPLDLWTNPAGVTALLARWTEKLAGGPQAGTSDSPTSKGNGSG